MSPVGVLRPPFKSELHGGSKIHTLGGRHLNPHMIILKIVTGFILCFVCLFKVSHVEVNYALGHQSMPQLGCLGWLIVDVIFLLGRGRAPTATSLDVYVCECACQGVV